MPHLGRMHSRLILSLLFTVAAHAGVEVDITKFGESLGGWKKESGKAAEYKFSESDYRTYKPEVTQSPDGGLFISVRVDHVRGMFSSNDHASLEMSFAPDGTLLSSQAAISIQERRISSDMFRSGGKSAAKAAGDLVGGVAEKAAKLSSDVFASLASKVLRENVTEPGRISYSAALRHNYNLLYRCVTVTKDPPRALPVEGEEKTAATRTPDKKNAPEDLLQMRTFGEVPQEEPKKEPEPAKP